MPYTRYEADQGVYGDGAIVKGPSFDQSLTASDASERIYVELPGKGSYVEWVVAKPGNGMVLRFTLPDSENGGGLFGELELIINGQPARTLSISSYHSWQYFDKVTNNEREPVNDPAAGNGRMRFDEIRVKLDQPLKEGDILRLQKEDTGEIPYGVDFIELELIDDVIPRPDGYLDVTNAPFNAVANDGLDDHAAIQSAIRTSAESGLGLYIPPGRYDIGDQLDIDRDGLRLLGAGIWHTELHFTRGEVDRNAGGFHGQASGVHISDFFMSSVTNARWSYRAFGRYFSDSVIENVWLTHFSVGFWIRDLIGTNFRTENLTVRKCRIRNTYADGLNFASCTSNSILEHSDIRNTGDDGTAMLASTADRLPIGTGNIFRYNTVEFIYRSAGIAIFGGQNHLVHHCIVRDTLAGAGARVSSVFPSWPFPENANIRMQDLILVRCGTQVGLWNQRLGAINLTLRRYDLQGITFSNIDILDPASDGIHIRQIATGFNILGVAFDNIKIKSTGSDETGAGYGLLVDNPIKGWIQLEKLFFQEIADEFIEYPGQEFELRFPDSEGDPSRGDSLQVDQIEVGDETGLTFPGMEGRIYDLERSLELLNWEYIQTIFPGKTGDFTLMDTDPPEGSAFYRITASVFEP